MTVILGDCLDVMDSIRGVNCIITDPPYGLNKNKILGDCDDSVFIQSVQKMYSVLDTGFVATFCSIAKIPEILNTFTNFGFKYEWTYICYINNGMVRGRMGFSCYMPVLIFSKGNAKIKRQLRDVCEISCGSEIKKRQHPYQKDERFIEPLIKTLTKEGDTILDPFAGSGVVGVCCKKTNRHYILIEKEEKYVDVIKKRLATVATT